MVGGADCAQRVLAYRFRFSEVNDEVDYVHCAKHEAKRTPHFDFANEIESGLRFYRIFLTSPLQLAFDLPAKSVGPSPWSAAFPRPRDERLIRPEPRRATVAGGVANGWDLWDVCDFIVCDFILTDLS